MSELLVTGNSTLRSHDFLTAPDEDVMIKVVDAAGLTVLETVAEEDSDQPSLFTYELGPFDRVHELTEVWTASVNNLAVQVVNHISVVRHTLYTVDEIRNYRGSELANEARFPDAKIEEDREVVIRDFSRYLGFSVVPRLGRDLVDGNGERTLWLRNMLPQELINVNIGGQDCNEGWLIYEDGYAVNPNVILPRGRQNITVDYEHGLRKNAPPFPPLKTAAMLWSIGRLAGNEAYSRVLTHTDETGTYRMALPNEIGDRPTGYPLVDSILYRWRETWGFA